MTKLSEHLMLFACDQKMEHLNKNFYGPGIPPEINDPLHLFQIAAHGRISAMATQLGLIAKYGPQFPDVNYIVKLNSKTNLIPAEQKDPLSQQLWTVDQVVALKKKTGLNIQGVGYTIYLGSEHESTMLAQAANLVFEAHMHGLLAILWMYPRGKAVTNERDGALIAGAAGVAAALGGDFAKVNPPDPSDGKSSAEWLAVAAQAAGKTKLLCSGGKLVAPEHFLHELYEQIHTGKVMGNATGRNIFGHELKTAIAMTKAISTITFDGATVAEAMKLLK